MYQDYQEEVLITNDHPYVEIEDSKTHGGHMDKKFNEYLDDKQIEKMEGAYMANGTLKSVDVTDEGCR